MLPDTWYDDKPHSIYTITPMVGHFRVNTQSTYVQLYKVNVIVITNAERLRSSDH